MTIERKPKSLTIPRNLPTREEIADLAEREVTVAMAIGQFRTGKIGYEDALRVAVVGLAAIAERAIAELTRQAQGDGSQRVVYLYPDPAVGVDEPSTPESSLSWQQGVALVAGAMSAGIMIGLAIAATGGTP